MDGGGSEREREMVKAKENNGLQVKTLGLKIDRVEENETTENGAEKMKRFNFYCNCHD